MDFFFILIALLLGSVGSIFMASLLFLLKDDQLFKVSTNLVSLAGGTLLKNGYRKRKALLYNTLSGMSALLGGLITWFAIGTAKQLIPYILAFSATSFIYISLANIVPQMHRRTKTNEPILQITLITVGILIIYLIKHQ